RLYLACHASLKYRRTRSRRFGLAQTSKERRKCRQGRSYRRELLQSAENAYRPRRRLSSRSVSRRLRRIFPANPRHSDLINLMRFRPLSLFLLGVIIHLSVTKAQQIQDSSPARPSSRDETLRSFQAI